MRRASQGERGCDDERLYLGYANAQRSLGRPIWISQTDRFAHLYILGRTGVGKSHLMKTLIQQDLDAGQGFFLLDPHGDLCTEINQRDRRQRDPRQRLRTYNVASGDLRLNPLARIPGIADDLTVATLLSVFQKLWEDNWGPRLEHLLRNVLYTLLANQGATLGVIPRLLVDKEYRTPFVRALKDKAVRSFWWDEYKGYTPGIQAMVIAPLQNKLGALLTDRRLRWALDTTEVTLDLDAALLDSQAIAINLAKGQMGEVPANLLGGLLTSRLMLAGLARARLAPEARTPFFAYLDEYPSYATSLLATGLSELRKYRLGLTLAHQYLSQLTPYMRDAALGNVGTLLCFRLGAADAAFISREFAPVFEPEDLLNLPNQMLYAKLLAQGQVSRGFSMRTYGEAPQNFEPKAGNQI